MEDPCEQSNESSGSAKGREILDQLKDTGYEEFEAV
jgi:hypothetical protein